MSHELLNIFNLYFWYLYSKLVHADRHRLYRVHRKPWINSGIRLEVCQIPKLQSVQLTPIIWKRKLWLYQKPKWVIKIQQRGLSFFSQMGLNGSSGDRVLCMDEATARFVHLHQGSVGKGKDHLLGIASVFLLSSDKFLMIFQLRQGFSGSRMEPPFIKRLREWIFASVVMQKIGQILYLYKHYWF